LSLAAISDGQTVTIK